ncbi:FAD-binding oxidoreductase [Candidatus Kaiserbacteria bacterium]|nr:FAD-binding oxidoreductase [Candidatus Kaiserbacteria bacterium]
MTLRERLAHVVKGDCADDTASLQKYSRDTSIFSRTPAVVVFPKDADDVAAVVRFARAAKQRDENVSVAARSAGTDMTGGPLTDSISLVFTRYMNAIIGVTGETVTAQPGVYYRDLEKETLKKAGKIIPSYPASRELCAFGGMVSNNSGGELTLRYGKTNKYVRSMNVVLSDGSRAILKRLSPAELAAKKSLQDLEGSIYRDLHALLDSHADEIEAARPNVTKNSAGYPLWNIIDRATGTFDLTQLIVAAQGTLAITTEATVGLEKLKSHRAMLVVFLSDVSILPDIVQRVMKFDPESFESYDDQTFKLAVRFAPQIIRHFGIIRMIKLGFAFIPETYLVFTGGVPKLVLMAEFAEDSAEEAMEKATQARAALTGLHVKTKIARSETQSAKYWTIRRESFALLRKNLKGLYAAPFIDDLVVHPADYPKFLPELDALLAGHKFIYTIAGHIGDGNFHIIPLENMGDPSAREEILDLMPKVYRLVAKYKGSITGEHNDGIIRTPYLPIMYGENICALFAEVKKIFDPLNILNPGKKTGGTVDDIRASMITHV